MRSLGGYGWLLLILALLVPMASAMGADMQKAGQTPPNETLILFGMYPSQKRLMVVGYEMSVLQAPVRGSKTVMTLKSGDRVYETGYANAHTMLGDGVGLGLKQERKWSTVEIVIGEGTKKGFIPMGTLMTVDEWETKTKKRETQ